MVSRVSRNLNLITITLLLHFLQIFQIFQMFLRYYVWLTNFRISINQKILKLPVAIKNLKFDKLRDTRMFNKI